MREDLHTLSNWNSEPELDKTWPNFKSHFKDAQTELKDIHGLTMQQAGYHHANMLAQYLQATMEIQGTEIITILQDFAAVQDANPPVEALPPAPAAKALAQTDVQLEMLRILEEIHQAYDRGVRGLGGRRSQGYRGRQGGQGGLGGRGYGNRNRNLCTLGNANFSRRVTDQYCHTHGG